MQERNKDEEISEEKEKWKEEEEEKLRDLVQQSNGKPSWVTISKQLDRNEKAVANKWREIKLGDNRKKGRWSQEEKDMLEKLVMESLRRMGKTDEVNSTKVLLNQKKEKQRDKIRRVMYAKKCLEMQRFVVNEPAIILVGVLVPLLFATECCANLCTESCNNVLGVFVAMLITFFKRMRRV